MTTGYALTLALIAVCLLLSAVLFKRIDAQGELPPFGRFLVMYTKIVLLPFCVIVLLLVLFQVATGVVLWP